jgi:hypothetical protein
MNNRNRDWTADIIRVLSRTSGSLTMHQLTQHLWELRKEAGKRPERFTETVQSTLNNHTSQASSSKGREGFGSGKRSRFMSNKTTSGDRSLVWVTNWAIGGKPGL